MTDRHAWYLDDLLPRGSLVATATRARPHCICGWVGPEVGPLTATAMGADHVAVECGYKTLSARAVEAEERKRQERAERRRAGKIR